MSEHDDHGDHHGHDGHDEPDVHAGALTRRGFMAVSAGGAMSALLASCNTPPQEHIVPYVDRPPDLTPGLSRYYATAALRRGVAIGVLAESRDGRPIKIEGNPEHPFSLGATGAIEQALPRTLYDLDRLNATTSRGGPASFDAFARELGPRADRGFTRGRGQGLHLWLSPTTSPLVEHLLDRLWERYPRAEVWFDPAGAPLTAWHASRLAFGRVLAAQYDFARADRVLALDADFLSDEPGSLRWARDWSSRRAPEDTGSMSRCYSVDSAPTGTSAAFDHRLTVRPSEIGLVAAALLAELGPSGVDLTPWRDRAPQAPWIRAVARDLAAHRGRTIVVAGEQQPAHVQLLALLINAALDSYGHTIRFTRAPWLRAGEDRFRPQPLMDALDAGSVDALLCLGGNPAYSARATFDFASRAHKAGDVIVLSEFPSETTRLGTWVIPELHILERWGDARAWDGTWTPIQPLIRPLFGGHSQEEVLLALTGDAARPVHEALKDLLHRGGLELPDVLARGLVDGSAFAEERAEADWGSLGAALEELDRTEQREGYELVLRRSRVDGASHAENPWLQEMPDLITRVSWDNVAQLAPEDARHLGIEEGDVVQITTPHGSARLPIVPVRSQARGTVIATLGYGRSAGGRTARDVGVDVSRLRDAPDTWVVHDVRLEPTGEHRELAMFHPHHELPHEHEVSIVYRTTLDHYRAHPGFLQRYDEAPPTLYPDRLTTSPQWGMAVDMNRCIGCQACVIACQAENNLPVVGKAQVNRGRAMHWLRIDAYFHESEEVEGEATRWSLQPMLCQHCEKAPCEYVCPVNATVHSPDGLNEMVYNRCVGTRFCSNNCPYKIRRFNWLDWHRTAEDPETMVFNPDVTVRGRGVMEKCTYCVQRIRQAQIRARADGRELADGDIVTACQQACPTGVFVFGDVSDRESRVSHWYERHRTYAVLHELGTRPRTRYLARIDNVNRELTGE